MFRFLSVTSKSARFLKLQVSIIGDKGLIAGKTWSSKGSIREGSIHKEGEGEGWRYLYELQPEDSAEAKSWRVFCGFEYENYEISPSIEAQPVKESSSCGSTSTLQADFLSLLEETSNVDVTFIIQGDEIKGHKAILSARSEYFRRMFASEMKKTLPMR